jgi:succinoglycan biosynthesis protein ExoA
MLGLAICTYRRPEGLQRLLAALPSACAGAAERILVLIVDNDGSDPRVEAIAQRAALEVRLFVETRPGISAARNRAVAEAEVAGITQLAMIDDDEWPEPGWLAGLLARQTETGAVVVGGLVEADFSGTNWVPEHLRRFWSVQPQVRDGRPFVHTTGNVLLELARLRDVDRPLFDDRFGLSGGGDLVFFSRLFRLGMPMAWAEKSFVKEEVPPDRGSLNWIRRRKYRVGNHMVVDELIRLGSIVPLLKTIGLLVRLPVYPVLNREPGARLAGWSLEVAKIRGRLAAHRGIHAVEYARDGASVQRLRAKAKAIHRRHVDPEGVLVCVPTLEEAAHIEACIRSLFRDDWWIRRVTVVVADGGSLDGTIEIVERLCRELPNLRLRQNPRRTQSAALNIVASGADIRHCYLVRCDAHAIYPDGYVRTAVETLAALEADVASVAAVMDAFGATPFARAAAWAVDTPLGSGVSAHRGGKRSGFVDHGHHAAFRLDWFRTVGGYDERFECNEDSELDRRLLAAGARIWLEAGLRLRYAMRDTIGGLARQYYRYGGWRARTLLLHGARPRIRQILPVGLLVALAMCLAGSLLQPALLLGPAIYGLLLMSASIACTVSTASAGGLWAGPALAVIHNAWAIGFLLAAARWFCRRSARIPADRAVSRATVATPGA